MHSAQTGGSGGIGGSGGGSGGSVQQSSGQFSHVSLPLHLPFPQEPGFSGFPFPLLFPAIATWAINPIAITKQTPNNNIFLSTFVFNYMWESEK